VKVKECSYEGCANNVQNRGVCVRHGAKRRECRYEGCSNHAIRVGFCTRHGPKRKDAATKDALTNHTGEVSVLDMGRR